MMKMYQKCCCGAVLHINQETMGPAMEKLVTLWTGRHASCHKRMFPYPKEIKESQ